VASTTATAVRARRRGLPPALSAASPFLVFVLVLLVWQLFAVTVAPLWLPPLGDVGSELVGHITSGDFAEAGAATLRTLAIGLVFTIVIAAVLAALLALNDVVDEALTTVLGGLMAVPSVALIPIYIFIWGLSDTTMVVSIVSFALLPLTLQWATAIREVPTHLIEMSRSFEASGFRLARSVYLPSVAPLLLTGLRVAVVQAIKGVISAEVIIGTVGIGRLLTVESSTFNMAGVWSVIVLIVIASIVSYAVLSWLETRASRWAD
jgi:ABC-type nitrate/sulfonate/bicarbonate transport system permease component